MDNITLAIAKSYIKSKFSTIEGLESFLDNVDLDYAFDNDTGAYYTVLRIYKNRVDGKTQYPFVYVPNGSDMADKSTYDIVANDGWVLAINGGVFNTETRKPDGILIEDGKVIQNSPTSVGGHIGNKPLTIDSEGNLGYAESDVDANSLVNSGIISALCGFLPIIVDYEGVESVTANSDTHAPRQIIGQWGNGDYAIITCEGRDSHNSDGWTLDEAKNICRKHGLKFAYNLDGGGSTETMLGLKHINTIYEGTTGRKVPSFIVFNGTDTYKINNMASGFEYLDSLYVPSGAYIKTNIPETQLFSCEYKAQNADFTDPYISVESRGHIMSSTNTYTPLLRIPSGALSNTGGYNGTALMLAKYKGTACEEIIQIDVDKPHIIKSDINNGIANIYIDGKQYCTANVGTVASASNNYGIFYRGGHETSYNWYFVGRVYYLKLWDESGNLSHYYRPVRRTADNTYGMLDTVENKFYPSDGSVAFSA